MHGILNNDPGSQYKVGQIRDPNESDACSIVKIDSNDLVNASIDEHQRHRPEGADDVVSVHEPQDVRDAEVGGGEDPQCTSLE